jgi:hypothetical protein
VPKTQTRYRDAITGKYVTEEYAKKHPKTTVKETDKVKRKKKRTPKKKSK